MKKILFILSIAVLPFAITSCGSKEKEKKHIDETHVHADGTIHANSAHNHEVKPNQESFEILEGTEHSRDGGSGGMGEESGKQFELSDTYDVTKQGVRLVLKFDKESNSFTGKMTNSTQKTVENARVEVHLSNGTELGPTKSVNLSPGASQILTLKATVKAFESWSTHVEIGSSEHAHSHDSSGEHEHSHEEGGEHNHNENGHN